MGQRDILSVGFRLIGVMAIVRGLGMFAMLGLFGKNVGEMGYFSAVIRVLLGAGVLLSSDFLANWLTDDNAEEVEFTGEWRIVSREGFRFVLRLVGAYALCMRILPDVISTVAFVQKMNLWGAQSLGECALHYGPVLVKLALAIYLLRGADFLVELAWRKDLIRFPTITPDDETDVEE